MPEPYSSREYKSNILQTAMLCDSPSSSSSSLSLGADQPSLHNRRQTHLSLKMIFKFFIAILTYDCRMLINLLALLDWYIVLFRSVVFRRMAYHHPSIRPLPSKLGSIGGFDQRTFLRPTSLNCFAQPCGPLIYQSIRCEPQWGFHSARYPLQINNFNEKV